MKLTTIDKKGFNKILDYHDNDDLTLTDLLNTGIHPNKTKQISKIVTYIVDKFGTDYDFAMLFNSYTSIERDILFDFFGKNGTKQKQAKTEIEKHFIESALIDYFVWYSSGSVEVIDYSDPYDYEDVHSEEYPNPVYSEETEEEYRYADDFETDEDDEDVQSIYVVNLTTQTEITAYYMNKQFSHAYDMEGDNVDLPDDIVNALDFYLKNGTHITDEY